MQNWTESIEIRISEALAAAKRVKNANLKALAREYDVPYQRLLRRHNGVSSKRGNYNATRALTKAQEDALLQTIDRLNGLYIFLTPKDIEDFANLILRR